MKSLIAILALVGSSVAVDVAAQCGDVAEDDVDPNNHCRLCHQGVFEFLPARTACDAERRLQCDANGAFRRECVETGVGDETTCESSYRWEECPNGLDCRDGFCLQTCVTDADCRPNFECRVDICEPASQSGDMGITTDMGTDMSVSDMGVPQDMPGPPDFGNFDVSDPGEDVSAPGDDMPGGGVKTQPDKGGCCAVAAPSDVTPWAALLLVGAIWIRRRRG